MLDWKGCPGDTLLVSLESAVAPGACCLGSLTNLSRQVARHRDMMEVKNEGIAHSHVEMAQLADNLEWLAFLVGGHFVCAGGDQ